jgi:hypothetical protein
MHILYTKNIIIWTFYYQNLYHSSEKNLLVKSVVYILQAHT